MNTFCCCLPSRIGVLLLSPLTCAASTVCSVIALYSLIQYNAELALGQRIFLGALGAAMAIVALSSVFGFVGALLKSYRAVSFYSAALLSIWLSVLATGVINFVFMYKDKDDFIDRCASRYEEEESLQQFQGYVDQEKWCNRHSTRPESLAAMGRKAEVQRVNLEKLMGPEAMGLTTQQLHFTDDKVCRNFLCGTCPHDLFSNTKVDLGTCPRSHTSRLKDEFRSSIEKGEQYPTFETEYENNIRTFMADIDRKIASNKRRIDQTPEETLKFTNLMRDISDVEQALNNTMMEVERLGEEGQIEESLAELEKAEALKVEKSDRERELQVLSDSAGASGHQKLRVCDVCGAYLSILDSDRRLADHFGGRMHLGYVKLREVIGEFDARRERGEDPRRLIAAGVGWRPSRKEAGGDQGLENGRPSDYDPRARSGPSASGPRWGPDSVPVPPSSDGYNRRPDDDYRMRNGAGGYGGGVAEGGDRNRDRDRRDRRGGGDYRDRSDRRRSRSPPPRVMAR
ncbi:hypothetical protein CBS101457_001921 [Exobasidium rhododendri]|nr:hypothetical protein CBS101457_001921 [Exobasidium rhododendri]